MKKKEKIFNILFWVNIILIVLIVYVLFLMFKYKNTCQFSVRYQDLNEICKIDKSMVYLMENYGSIKNTFYILIFSSAILTIMLLIINIIKKGKKKIIALILILILLGGSYLFYKEKIETYAWTAITSYNN